MNNLVSSEISSKNSFEEHCRNSFRSKLTASQGYSFMNEHINFDFGRTNRTGIPEVIYAEGKEEPIVLKLLEDFALNTEHPIMFTRLSPSVFRRLSPEFQSKYSFDALAKTAYSNQIPKKVNGRVAIVSAGTSDGFVTWEAKRTLDYLNVKSEVFEDCGVSGLWRLQEKLSQINSFDIIITVAGMEAALVSVLAGLTSKPIIGVPTSIGYGVCKGGQTALNSMLACCAPGVAAVNIDNGFGAACMAYKTLLSCKGSTK